MRYVSAHELNFYSLDKHHLRRVVSAVAYAYPPSISWTGCSLMTPQTDALNKVNTKPIFLSNTLKRAIRFSSGPSDSCLVVTVKSLTCCDSLAYSHKTFASNTVRLACDSYGFASNMPMVPDMNVKPTKDWSELRYTGC